MATQAPQVFVKCDSMRFVKMHGLGNDFVMLESAELGRVIAEHGVGKAFSKADLRAFCATLTQKVCDRHIGIGGDGMIVAIKVQDLAADKSPYGQALSALVATYPDWQDCQIAWIYINSDGSYSEMCGNGMRCLGRFVSSLGWLKPSQFRVATAAYPVTITVKEKVVHTRLSGPVFDNNQAPLMVRGQSLDAVRVSMGNPHCVVFSQSVLDIEAAMAAYALDIERSHGQGLCLNSFPAKLVALAEEIQKLPAFPQGVNVEFVHLNDPENACTFVVERGCGPTLACASGAAAVLAAGVKTNRLNKKSYVILPGGKLEAHLLNEPEEIELIGPAVQVFSGAISLMGPGIK